jgi:hypothetical protein
MGQVLHGSATTTHAIRAEIQRSAASLKELAAQYGLNQKTVAKWRERAFVQDAPMGPRKSCGHRFPQAHAAASGRLPLCLAGDDPASDPLLAPPVPATARHQPLTRGRRRHAQEDRQTRPHRLLPHRHRQGQDRRGQAPFVRGHRPNIQVRLGTTALGRQRQERSWLPPGACPSRPLPHPHRAHRQRHPVRRCPSSTGQDQRPATGCTCSTGFASATGSSTASSSPIIHGPTAKSRG